MQGTIYVGTHAGGEERVLWFRLEQGPGTDGRIYPTVYTLWHNPGLVPLLHTQSLVMEKLYGGADLMVPGLTNGPPFPERAVKNAVVAVADIQRPSVPTFVGVCEIDVSSLGRVQGAKGHAVRGVQWEGDELWSWSLTGRPGQPSPAKLDGWFDTQEKVGEAMGDLQLNENDAAPIIQEEAGKGALSEGEGEDGSDIPQDSEKEPSTKGKGSPFIFLSRNHSGQLNGLTTCRN